MMLRRGLLSLRATAHFRRLATTSSPPSPATPEEDGSSSGFFSSWFGKIKDSIQSKISPSPEAPLTLLACADELKKASRIANLSSLPKSIKDLNLEKFSTIYSALGKYNPTGQNIDSKQKALAAEECKCSVQEVEKALTVFEGMKTLTAKLKKMQERGEKVPKTMEEMSKLVNGMPGEHLVKGMPTEHPVHQSTDVGRNAPCTCGSGKKFKRCCGRGK